MISVVIPVYNEEKMIGKCLASLARQTMAKEMEVIVVDDGSTDDTKFKVKSQKLKVNLLTQKHLGPGAARNLGAGKAKGDILVFVDADMEFAPDFVEKLCRPIKGNVIGTYSTREYLLNKDKPIARCWNLNLGRSSEQMEPRGYARRTSGWYKLGKSILEKIEGRKANEEQNKVFRAISREKFLSVGGFDPNVGYTDDWTVSEKLGQYPVAVSGAIYYHRSPETYKEAWQQARWVGKNEFLTRNFIRKLYNLFRYNPLFSVINGLWGSWKFKEPRYFLFKVVYDAAVFVSVCQSFFSQEKYK